MRHQAHAGKALTDVRRPVAVDTHGRRGGRRRLIPADFVLAAIGIPLLGLATCGRPRLGPPSQRHRATVGRSNSGSRLGR